MSSFMGRWLFTLQFKEARWRFDRRLKGDDEQRLGGGGGMRWATENWQRKCCTNNNQWRSVWGRAADSAFLNNERNEKLKMSNLIILSSAASVMHGGLPAGLRFISLQRGKKMKADKVSRSPIEYRKDDSSCCLTHRRAASFLEDCGLTSRSSWGFFFVFHPNSSEGEWKVKSDGIFLLRNYQWDKPFMKIWRSDSLIEQIQNHFSLSPWLYCKFCMQRIKISLKRTLF